ncbi:hypothetical protein DFP72DRAFT_1085521 [Ephemerocybe angulata]|uniref:Uncharacterized protein n=1 Tax=Ephemerocybe angulata TaxID=980116 RepID=A0A8H6LTW8_9AGAR|nr:hypothetical protein DFP72DRAFT_1085521 [Tulosesus angulatus]
MSMQLVHGRRSLRAEQEMLMVQSPGFLNAPDAAMGRGVTADCLEHLHLPWPHRHLQGLDGESPSLCTGDRELGLAHAGPIASDSSTRDPSSDVKSFPSHAIDSKQGAISVVVRAIMPSAMCGTLSFTLATSTSEAPKLPRSLVDVVAVWTSRVLGCVACQSSNSLHTLYPSPATGTQGAHTNANASNSAPATPSPSLVPARRRPPPSTEDPELGPSTGRQQPTAAHEIALTDVVHDLQHPSPLLSPTSSSPASTQAELVVVETKPADSGAWPVVLDVKHHPRTSVLGAQREGVCRDSSDASKNADADADADAEMPRVWWMRTRGVTADSSDADNAEGAVDANADGVAVAGQERKKNKKRFRKNKSMKLLSDGLQGDSDSSGEKTSEQHGTSHGQSIPKTLAHYESMRSTALTCERVIRTTWAVRRESKTYEPRARVSAKSTMREEAVLTEKRFAPRCVIEGQRAVKVTPTGPSDTVTAGCVGAVEVEAGRLIRTHGVTADSSDADADDAEVTCMRRFLQSSGLNHPLAPGHIGPIFVLKGKENKEWMDAAFAHVAPGKCPENRADALDRGYLLVRSRANPMFFWRDMTGSMKPEADRKVVWRGQGADTLPPKEVASMHDLQWRVLGDEAQMTSSKAAVSPLTGLVEGGVAFERNAARSPLPKRRGPIRYLPHSKFKRAGATAAMAGLEAGSEELKALLDDRASYLNVPRVGIDGNTCPTFQLNIAAAAEANAEVHLTESLGTYGGAHPDCGDSAGGVTGMTCLTPPHPDTKKISSSSKTMLLVS